MEKKKILCLDIEGGHGGSSRSLFYLLKRVNKKKFGIEVICKKNSWVKKEYLKNNIHCSIENTMPCYPPLEKLNRNFLPLIYFFIFIWPKSKKFRMKLIKKLKNIDILHCNQTSLFFLALWLIKKNPNIKIIFHIRTIFWPNEKNQWHFIFKWVAKSVVKISNRLIFITENEKENLSQVSGQKIKGKVLYNSLPDYENKWKINKVGKIIKIISMSHHNIERGTDRIIELASYIPSNLKNKFQFIVIGNHKQDPNFFEKYFIKLSIKKDLRKYAKKMKVTNMFKFYGYIKKPEHILERCDILIKLARKPTPWGRDIIEGMGAGKIIVSCGNYNKFIRSNHNGLLLKKYEPIKIINWLLKIEKNRKLFLWMKKNSIKCITKLCSQTLQSKKIETVWNNLN